jgi:hypothetical protein
MSEAAKGSLVNSDEFDDSDESNEFESDESDESAGRNSR